MRIISGKFKGRRIDPPRGVDIRPTTDLAREALFNILSNRFDFEGLHVLDLFAGSGAVSFEFLSRGCKSVSAVEQQGKLVSFMKDTALKLDEPGLTVIRDDVSRFLARKSGPYDIIFADPPFSLPWLQELPHRIWNAQLMSDQAWLIVEHPPHIDLSKAEGFQDHRHYGHVHFSFFYT